MSRRRSKVDPAAKQKKQIAVVVLLLIGLAVAVATMPDTDEAVNSGRGVVASTSDRAEERRGAAGRAEALEPAVTFPRRPIDWYVSRNPFGRDAAVESDVPVTVAVSDAVTVRAVYGGGGRHRALVGSSEAEPGTRSMKGRWDDRRRRFVPGNSTDR